MKCSQILSFLQFQIFTENNCHHDTLYCHNFYSTTARNRYRNGLFNYECINWLMPQQLLKRQMCNHTASGIGIYSPPSYSKIQPIKIQWTDLALTSLHCSHPSQPKSSVKSQGRSVEICKSVHAFLIQNHLGTKYHWNQVKSIWTSKCSTM